MNLPQDKTPGLPFSPTTILGNLGRLVAGVRFRGRHVVGVRFRGRHVARDTSNRKARMGYLPGRHRRAYIVSGKQLSAMVDGFPERHVPREPTIN
nr:hypothetical protein [Tanacetum cinerariifolium]